MRQLGLFFGLFFLIGTVGWAEDVHTYEASLVKIPRGTHPGELGYTVGPGIVNTASQPVVFGDEIYIMDVANGRLNVYDKNFVFIRSVHFDEHAQGITHAYHFGILEDGGIIGISSVALVRASRDGRTIYSLPLARADTPPTRLPEHVWNGGIFWIYKDYLLYRERPMGGEYRAIDGKGKFLSRVEVGSLADDMKRLSSLRSRSSELEASIDKFLQENDVLLDGDNDTLLTLDGDMYLRFYKLIGENMNIKVLAKSEYWANGVTDIAVSFHSDGKGSRLFDVTTGTPTLGEWLLVSSSGVVLDHFTVKPKKPFVFAGDGNLYEINVGKSAADPQRLEFNVYSIKVIGR